MVRWLVVCLAGLLALTIYLHRTATSPARTSIIADFRAAGWDFDDKGMGDVQAAFSWGYLFQVVGGIVGARFGNRFALTFFAVGTSLSILGSGMATSPAMLWWTTFGIGVTQAGIIPCVSQLIKDWVPIDRRGLASGIFTGSMSIGSALATFLTGLLLAYTRWPAIFVAYAVIGFCWSLGFSLWFRNRPEEHSQVNPAELALIYAGQQETGRKQTRASWKVWWSMLYCWNQWANCLQQFCRNFFFTFFITGFPAFLEYAYEIPASEAGMLSAIPLTTVIVGLFVGGQSIDAILRRTGSHWLSRSALAGGGHLICGLLVLAAAWAPNVNTAVALIGAGIFFFGFGSPCTWAITMDIAGKYTSPFIAVSNTVGVIAGIWCPKVTGQMFVDAKSGAIGWDRIFFLFAGINLLAAILWFSINSKYPAKIPE